MAHSLLLVAAPTLPAPLLFVTSADLLVAGMSLVACPLSLSSPNPPPPPPLPTPTLTPKALLLLLVFCEYARESAPAAVVESAAGEASDPSSELLVNRCVSGDATLGAAVAVLLRVSTRRGCFWLDVLGVWDRGVGVDVVFVLAAAAVVVDAT